MFNQLGDGMDSIMTVPTKKKSKEDFMKMSDDDYEKEIYAQGMSGGLDFDSMEDYEQQRLLDFMMKKDAKPVDTSGKAQAQALGMSQTQPQNVVGLPGLMQMASKGTGVQQKQPYQRKLGLMGY